MEKLLDTSSFTVPLGWEAHQLAQQFRQHQRSTQKAKQVYLNTLAIYAVKTYLQCLEIETNWEASDSWNSLMQTIMDVADLEIPNFGKLECRPVLPNSQIVEIPSEVWEDRIGYVAVLLDSSLKQATILGFVETVATEELPLIQLHSLDELIENLSSPTQPEIVKTPVKERVNLGQWLHNIVDKGWETMEALFAPPQTEPTFNFRKSSQAKTRTPESVAEGVKRGKRIDLERGGEQVVLVVELIPTAASEFDICVKLSPTGGKTELLAGLQLIVLDATGKAMMQTEAARSKTIEFQFTGELGEHFGVKVAIDEFSIIEEFLI